MGDRMQLRKYGDTELVTLDVDDECAHCLFVHQHLFPSGPLPDGEVVFVCLGPDNDNIRRIEVIDFLGVATLACRSVTPEQIEAELKSKALGSA